MANRIKMTHQSTILVLWQRGWSNRRIAKELGVHRVTVARCIALAKALAGAFPAPPALPDVGDSKSTISTPGSSSAATAPADGPSPALAAASARDGGNLGRQSHCETHRAFVLEKVEAGLSARRIYQDLVEDQAFAGSYQSVKRFVRHLIRAHDLPFRRIEVAPGEEMQVDFGTGAPIVDDDGKRRHPWVFRTTLSFSRKGYSEAVDRQTTENFLRALENSFHYFGGVPVKTVLDNLKAAVTKADWFDPLLHPKIVEFARHYGTVILPTKINMPRHKGKIEAGIKYVKNNGLKGRTFKGLAEENRFLLQWEEHVADKRIHGTTRKQVGALFEAVERPALRPLPAERFPFFHEAPRSVHRDGHVEVDRAYYSVPPEYLGRRVWARWDSRLVRIYVERSDRMDLIATHAKREAGRFATAQEHIASEKISAVERGAEYLLKKIRLMGAHCAAWAEAALSERGIAAVRALQGLLSLSGRHPVRDLDSACERALSHGAYHLGDVRSQLAQPSRQGQFGFIQSHPLIRDLSEYGSLVKVDFNAEPIVVQEKEARSP